MTLYFKFIKQYLFSLMNISQYTILQARHCVHVIQKKLFWYEVNNNCANRVNIWRKAIWYRVVITQHLLVQNLRVHQDLSQTVHHQPLHQHKPVFQHQLLLPVYIFYYSYIYTILFHVQIEMGKGIKFFVTSNLGKTG